MTTRRHPEQAAADVVAWLLRVTPCDAHRRVIAVAGESGAGKTSLAVAMARRLGAAVLHQDDFFYRPPRENHAFRLEHPELIGLGEVSFVGLEAALRRAMGRWTVVEGTYAGWLDGVDRRIFIGRHHRETLADRLARGRDPIDEATVRILDREHPLIAAQQRYADLVVTSRFEVRQVGR